ncbi:MAG TPA: hypothetical protein IAA18_02330, partial [Candidatus Pseudomonas excrementavium]|nr:hypothetical protein [Candidatus Pseudomonas excrementavium]
MTEREFDRQAREQALRLQRFFLAQLIYCITYVVIGVTWATGAYIGSLGVALSHYVIGIAT